MTPQFTASAYVRIDDENKMKEITQSLIKLGYTRVYGYLTNYLSIHNGTYSLDYASFMNYENIDCETDIDLFLELAQIRSDTDKGQWFIEDKIRTDGIGGQIVGCEPIRKIGERMVKYERDDKGVTNHINECNNNGGRCFIRRATPSQVYEHLKRR
jgi:hypothetical protein